MEVSDRDGRGTQEQVRTSDIGTGSALLVGGEQDVTGQGAWLDSALSIQIRT